MKPDRVKAATERKLGRPLTQGEEAAMLQAALKGDRGKKKRAKEMQKAILGKAAKKS